jgi:CheY-like chemotaxis protein
VLSDIVMPGRLNGIEFALTLRRNGNMIPVLLLTGYTAELHRAMAAGLEVLPKPCSPLTLASALEAVLGKASRPEAGAARSADVAG